MTFHIIQNPNEQTFNYIDLNIIFFDLNQNAYEFAYLTL